MLYKLLELAYVADGFVGVWWPAAEPRKRAANCEKTIIFVFCQFHGSAAGHQIPMKPPATQAILEQIETLSSKRSLQASRLVRANTD